MATKPALKSSHLLLTRSKARGQGGRSNKKHLMMIIFPPPPPSINFPLTAFVNGSLIISYYSVHSQTLNVSQSSI